MQTDNILYCLDRQKGKVQRSKDGWNNKHYRLFGPGPIRTADLLLRMGTPERI